MNTLWEKIKKSETALGLLVGGAALVLLAVVISVVVAVVVHQQQKQAAEPTVSQITLDYSFDKTAPESEASSVVSKATSKEAASKPANTRPATPSEQATIGGVFNTSSASVSSKLVSSAYTPTKPKGTLAKVSATDRKGLAKRNKARASYLADVFYTTFFDETLHLQVLNYPAKNNVETATAWEYGALQSMQTVVTKMDKTKKQLNRLKAVNTGLDYYGRMKNGEFWGYVVHRGAYENGATEDGLAYDDNMWFAINLVRSYELTGEKAYLDRAKYLVKFIINDAWFEPLGGIFWDTRHEARHSCSNNPMIKVLVDIYNHTGEKYYLNWAIKIYDFSRSNLKDEQKNIYEDLIRAHQINGVWIEGSSKNTGFYSYNTGTMISGAAALYGATGDKKYLDEALSCAQGAMDYFGDRGILNGYTGFACTSNIWFNAILLRGYIDLYPYAKKETAKYIEEFQKSMDFAYETYNADAMGVMPYDWLRGWDSSDRSTYRNALDMSANAEMYGMLATWQQTRTD